MQSTVYAAIAGKVVKRLVHPGHTVEAKELLLVKQIDFVLRESASLP